uniref:Uncharacterized protein n=1 Tax=Arundo donax TaxID=35708 RepID=A0A0A9F8H6_ARUDO
MTAGSSVMAASAPSTKGTSRTGVWLR